jgi:hypothetical protein
MKLNNSGCLTGFVAGLSRIFLVMAWIARPGTFDAVFGSWIVPCLGFFFLPFTTLIYIILYTPGVALSGLDWLWLILAVVLDVGSVGFAVNANRDQIPQGVPGALPPQSPTGTPPTAPKP